MNSYGLTKKKVLKITLISIAAFLAITFIYAGESYYYFKMLNRVVSFKHKVLSDLSGWLPWAFFVPIIIWLGRRFPLEQKTWTKNVPLHFFAAVFFTVFQAELTLLLNILFKLDNTWTIGRQLAYILSTGLMMIFVYWVILAISLMIDNYKRYKLQEVKASQMETQLAQTHLNALKMQLQPHFLFNTLNMINELMFEDVFAANKMIAQLSDLLRFSLDKTNIQEISLKEEIRFVELYLNIQKNRFKDKLKTEINISSETLEAIVPTLVLQPIVENAITHGISAFKKEGKIKIVSCQEEEKLVLEVHDSGKGINFEDGLNFNSGVGITNTIERLKQLYPENHKFDLLSSSLGGLLVRIEIPFNIVEENGNNGRTVL